MSDPIRKVMNIADIEAKVKDTTQFVTKTNDTAMKFNNPERLTSEQRNDMNVNSPAVITTARV